MPIKYHYNLIQQTVEWYSARCGLLTASDMAKIIAAKKLEYAENDTARSHLNELLAQRITKFVEPCYRSDDMLRGLEDEKDAKNAYEKSYFQVKDCGFITNDNFGFTLGYSPDGLVGEDGLVEVKGRRAKYQIETIIAGVMPDEFRIQVQTGLLVSGRKYCDFISYSNGLPMLTLRIEPDELIQDAIIACATEFHTRLKILLEAYQSRLLDKGARLVPTERRVEQEITI